MNLLKVTTIEGTREFLNIDRILALQESADGTKVKILMGAGLYWWVWTDSLRTTNIYEFLSDLDETMGELEEIEGGENNA